MNSDPFDDALNNKKVNAFIVRWEPKIRERVGDRSVSSEQLAQNIHVLAKPLTDPVSTLRRQDNL
jgi:ribosomal protein L1